VRSWRPEALDALRELGFAGTVLVPEPRDWSARLSYLDWLYRKLTGLAPEHSLLATVQTAMEAIR
jgi:hypothetical protein